MRAPAPSCSTWRGRRSGDGGGRVMTSVRAVRAKPSGVRADLMVVPIAEGGLQEALRGFDRKLTGALTRRAKAVDFRGRPDDMLVHHGDRDAVALVGLGRPATDTSAWRRASAR